MVRISQPVPLDIETMRTATGGLLSDGAAPPADELDLLIIQLRGHLHLLIPELEHRFGQNDDARARAGIGEARRRLSAGPTSLGPMRHAECLARSVVALCAHLERLAVSP
ncbi:DUF6415 family natural product biosynthesis protein [Streptomyces sp. NBC_01506]|uniref:DUF6415 family natural product biosynthesis protein n=1 Tax=Streptomyces sp. NBC_01506 TaxID=2903887 RepID=UPI00386DE78C